MTKDAQKQNTDFALSADGNSTAPPQADDPKYTPGLLDETADSKESDNTSGGGSDEGGKVDGGTSGGVQSQAEDNGGKTNADADASDPNKTVKADGPVETPGTTETKSSGSTSKK